MAKAIQCPSCGRKHRVASLPDAPTFKCEDCGQPLKVPAQFRPSVMASSRHVPQPDPPRPSEATAVLPERSTPASPAPAARAPAPAPRKPGRPAAASAAPVTSDAIALPLRLLAWAAALVLGLVVTLWVARVTGWLSGDRLVDVFTDEGWARYIRVIAIAPVWALFTTLLLTMFLEGGRALARRRAEKRAESAASRRGARRGESEPFDTRGDGDPGRDGDASGYGRQSKRAAARRGGP
jgi:hypothetical protein